MLIDKWNFILPDMAQQLTITPTDWYRFRRGDSVVRPIGLRAAMSLMDELYQDAMTAKSYVYAVILTMNPDSTVTLTVPDFPNIVMENMDFNCGIQLVKEKISEEVLTMFMPPVPTPSEQIPLAAGQMIVQVAAGE